MLPPQDRGGQRGGVASETQLTRVLESKVAVAQAMSQEVPVRFPIRAREWLGARPPEGRRQPSPDSLASLMSLSLYLPL